MVWSIYKDKAGGELLTSRSLPVLLPPFCRSRTVSVLSELLAGTPSPTCSQVFPRRSARGGAALRGFLSPWLSGLVFLLMPCGAWCCQECPGFWGATLSPGLLEADVHFFFLFTFLKTVKYSICRLLKQT